MIYFVKDFYFPDFGGFGWTAGAKYALPDYMHRIKAIESSATWEEIHKLYVAIHSNSPYNRLNHSPGTLIESATTAPFRDRIIALGQVILPGDFFHDPRWWQAPEWSEPPAVGRRYQPQEKWRITSNIDGDTGWVEDVGNTIHEARLDVFDALTPDLEGNVWTDWHRFPPKQQTLMQHWAAEVQARRGESVKEGGGK